MTVNDTDYDEDLFTDTSMFDADEIVRSVEEVALAKEAEKKLSARRRFEILMDERKLAADLEDAYDEDWDDDFDKNWDDGDGWQ